MRTAIVHATAHSQNGRVASHSTVMAHAPKVNARLNAAHDANEVLRRPSASGRDSKVRER